MCVAGVVLLGLFAVQALVTVAVTGDIPGNFVLFALGYFAVVRVRGPAWDEARRMREQDGWPEHARFMDELAASGFIVLGGPLGDDERFLLVCDAEDERAVRKRLAEDSWSSSGLLEVSSVEPWTILLEGGS